MADESGKTGAGKARPSDTLRYILTISLSLVICALIGVAYAYV